MNETLQIPYCGTAPLPGELLQRWNLDPVLLLVLAVLMYGHFRCAALEKGDAVAFRRTCFVTGWSALTFALVSPLCALSVALFSARVTQHMWLVFVAAPLLIFAMPRTRDDDRLQWVSPLLAAGVFALSLWLWHAPALYALTFTSDTAYWLMHLMLMGSALLLWHVLLQSRVERALVRLGVGFFSLVQMGMLGALITLAPRLLYSPHALTAQAWGLLPLGDQQLGGLIMWVPAGAALFVACLASVASLLRASSDEASDRPWRMTQQPTK